MLPRIEDFCFGEVCSPLCHMRRRYLIPLCTQTIACKNDKNLWMAWQLAMSKWLKMKG